MAFLEVLTRVLATGGRVRRPTLLARNQESMTAQTDPDWIQTLIYDYEGGGVAAANVRLRTQGASGEYVWQLDDDDLCVMPGLVAELKRLASIYEPEVFVVRVDHGEQMGILPPDGDWERNLHRYLVGGSSLIVRSDMWYAHRDAWGEAYDGDWNWICDVMRGCSNVVWLDQVAARVQRISRGQPESKEVI